MNQSPTQEERPRQLDALPEDMVQKFSKQLVIDVTDANGDRTLNNETETNGLQNLNFEAKVKMLPVIQPLNLGGHGTLTGMTTSSTTSSDFVDNRFESNRPEPLDKDSEGRIAAYVDFDEIFQAVEEAKRKGLVPPDYNV